MWHCFCWQCFSDLGPVLLSYLHCLCQSRQFCWHHMVPFVGLVLLAHLPYYDVLQSYSSLECVGNQRVFKAHCQCRTAWQMGEFALGEKPYCIYWALQNTKQHPFLILAGIVCIACVCSFFPLSFWAWVLVTFTTLRHWCYSGPGA